MITFNEITNKIQTRKSPKHPYILYHPYKELMAGGPGSGKRNKLLNLYLINQTFIKFIYMRITHVSQDINI